MSKIDELIAELIKEAEEGSIYPFGYTEELIREQWETLEGETRAWIDMANNARKRLKKLQQLKVEVNSLKNVFFNRR